MDSVSKVDMILLNSSHLNSVNTNPCRWKLCFLQFSSVFFFRSYIDEILGFPLAAANRLHLLNEIYESFPGLGTVFRGEKIQKTLKLSDHPI